MTSRREQRPRRSDGETSHSSTRDQRYRFKSYMEANTQEQARFDAMRHSLPTKIDEVMASFREEKLTVHQHEAVANGYAESLPMPRRRSWWPWALGGALVISIGITWFSDDHEAASEAETHAVALAQETTPVVTPPPVVVQSPAPQAVPVAAPVAKISPVKIKPVAPPVKRVVHVNTRPLVAVATPSASRVQPVVKKPSSSKHHHATPAQPDHYSEDLSNLLQH